MNNKSIFKKAISLTFILCLLIVKLSAQTAERIYLSGKEPSNAVEWDFYCSEGRKSGVWTKIPVPSNWEQHGFGGYDYGHILPNKKNDEYGIYKTNFFAPKEWENKYVRLVFEGAMTETSVKLNGVSLGAPNQGGYLPFRFPLNSYNTYLKKELKYNEQNQLEIKVLKRPSNTSLDIAERKADYWVFGGIYRPVYIEVLPKIFINRLAIDAKADGRILLDVFPQTHRETKFKGLAKKYIDLVEAQVFNHLGEAVGEPFSEKIDGAVGRVRLSAKLKGIKPWSTESPHLYSIRVYLKNDGKIISEKIETFGFRTFQVKKGDGLYLNGKKLIIKGINRNGMDSQTARALDSAKVWDDARMIKQMNVNLVRSHLPPTTAFMKACDSLGLLVITELVNWQRPYVDSPIAHIQVHEMVVKYQNHPSVVLWANGNEGGFNPEVDELYHLYDLQDRTVIHPWATFEGIDTRHYPEYNQMQAKVPGEMIYLPTELLHGLYDGGHGAGLNDYWKLMMDVPTFAGGVLWCWADAAIARTDKDGMLDTAGNYSADGIVGPNGEKEASYYTVREIWSPVQIKKDEIENDFNGVLPISNQYVFTNLNECTFQWKLINYKKNQKDKSIEEIVTFKNAVVGPDVMPEKTGKLALKLPKNWKNSDALSLKAIDKYGMEVMEWVWPIKLNQRISKPTKAKNLRLLEGNIIKLGKTSWLFDENTGHLKGCISNGKDTGLGNGPLLYAANKEGEVIVEQNWQATFIENKQEIIVKSTNKVDGSSFKWVFNTNGNVSLHYAFTPFKNALTYCAVGFELPEKAVQAKQWMGNGPHRVWGNRMKGPQFGVWQNTYNNTIPGHTWEYPAFKGVFSDVNWIKLFLNEDIQLNIEFTEKSNIGVLVPDNLKNPTDSKKAPKNMGTKKLAWDYPSVDGIYVFHKIPAIGTKFKLSEQLGPESQPKMVDKIEGVLKFHIKHNQ